MFKMEAVILFFGSLCAGEEPSETVDSSKIASTSPVLIFGGAQTHTFPKSE